MYERNCFVNFTHKILCSRSLCDIFSLVILCGVDSIYFIYIICHATVLRVSPTLFPTAKEMKKEKKNKLADE